MYTLLLTGVLLVGCSCEDDSESKKGRETVDLSKPPSPLVVKAVPKELKVRVFPQKGATDPRPIALVVAKNPDFCATVREGWKTSGHVLCIDESTATAESRLRKAISYMKKTYPRHVGKPPVHLFADGESSGVGWRLMLKEPGFFAYAFLPGLEEKALTHTTLSALHGQGARQLVLGIDSSKRLNLLQTVAARRGLEIHPLGARSKSLEEVVALMKSRDSRLSASPAPPTDP